MSEEKKTVDKTNAELKGTHNAESLFETELSEEVKKMHKRERAADLAKDLGARLGDLEDMIKVRDEYANKQQEIIEEQRKKIDEYERFLHALQLNYQILKDHRAVQDLIDRACHWSLSYRDFKGELSVTDRAAALDMARRRLRQAKCWSRKVMWNEFCTDWTGLWPEDLEAVLEELSELRAMFVDKQRGKP